MKPLFVYIARPNDSSMPSSDDTEWKIGLQDAFDQLIRAGIPTHLSSVYSKHVLFACSHLLVIQYPGFEESKIISQMIDFARANDIDTTVLRQQNLDNFIKVMKNRAKIGTQQPDQGKGK